MIGDKHQTRHAAAGLGVLILLILVVTPAGPTVAGDKQAWSPAPLTGEAGDLPDPRVVIQRALDFVQSHEKFGFEVLSTYEAVQESGQKLQFDMLQRVAIKRPDQLFWKTLHDDAATDSAWYKDGKFTLLRQPANVWGRVAVPSTLPEAMSSIAYEYKVPVPFADLLTGDAGELWLGEDVEWVNYIGEAWADGQWTDHVALRRPGVDIQIWFRQGDEPYPVKMAIVRTDEDGQPGFSARFREWYTRLPNGAIPEFVPPDGAERLEIVPVIGP